MKQSSCSNLAHVNLLDLNTVSDAQLLLLLDWLNAEEQARYARFTRVLRQRQFLAGRVLLRWTLMQLTNLPLSAIRLTERPQNAPLLQLDGSERVPEFSLSHTGNWVACACSSSVRLGLDVEMLDPTRNLDGVARHSFSTEDLEWLQHQPEPVQGFYFLWSRREARYKLHQRHVDDAAEHCYVLPHRAMSVVLVCDVALSAEPVWHIMDGQELTR